MEKRYCENCGGSVFKDAVICPNCGKQIGELKTEKTTSNAQVVINNNIGTSDVSKKKCDKWVAFLLCVFFGWLGVHKFYEEKIGLGIVYIITFGLFGIGWFIDIITILCKKNPYYV